MLDHQLCYGCTAVVGTEHKSASRPPLPKRQNGGWWFSTRMARALGMA
jgi:hypothetical protein